MHRSQHIFLSLNSFFVSCGEKEKDTVMLDDDIALSSSLFFFFFFCQMLRGHEKSFQAHTMFYNLWCNQRDAHSGADYVSSTDILTLCQKDFCGVRVRRAQEEEVLVMQAGSSKC